MTRMNLNVGAKLHNKHHIVLTDAKTGKIKQEAWAYNAVLNQGLVRLINFIYNGNANGDSDDMLFGNDVTYGWGGTTFVGNGVMAVSPTDTQLAGYLSRKTNSLQDSGYDIGTLVASHTRKAVWDETEIQNTAITEVGLGVDNQTTGLSTRALIKDSEGNQITINKGTTDILSIYSTVYIELSHTYGSNLKFAEGVPITSLPGGSVLAGNALLKMVQENKGITAFASTTYGYQFVLQIGRNSDAVSNADPACKTKLVEKGFNKTNVDVVADTSNKRIKFLSLGTGGAMRIGSTEGNHEDGIWEIGMFLGLNQGTAYARYHSLFRAVMPIAGVWPGTTITDEELGTGTGSQTVFQTTWAPVLSGTDVVKVDGVTKTRGTDYTINLETGDITFATAPGTGAAVTCTYGIEQIPKDSNHVLDISFTIQFADGSV